MKPEGGSQGDGIFLVQNASDLRLKLDAKPHFGAGFGALAQRYLPDPLLLDGLKFDLRLYVVLLSVEPLEAYLCKEGLARFCTQSYEAPSSSNMNEARTSSFRKENCSIRPTCTSRTIPWPGESLWEFESSSI